MIVLLPLIALSSLLGALVVTGAPSFARNVALTSSRAAKFDHAKACGGNNFCLTCVIASSLMVDPMLTIEATVLYSKRFTVPLRPLRGRSCPPPSRFLHRVQVGDNAFGGIKTLFGCGITASGDWNDGQRAYYTSLRVPTGKH